MAGLESIALAVAHLERQKASLEEEKQQHQLSTASWGWQPTISCDATRRHEERTTAVDEVPTMTEPPPLPPREPISARRVSSDSSFSEEHHEQKSMGDSVNGEIDVDTMTDVVPPTLESLFAWEKSQPSIPSPDVSEDIVEVRENDVLCGRGGETNHFVGNVRYRSLVKYYQRLYLEARRRDKPLIARVIVRTVRLRGGRFLKKDANAKYWKDVGNQRAREKTSQALREGAPDLRVPSGEQGSRKVKIAKKSNQGLPVSGECLAEIQVESSEDLEIERAPTVKRPRVSLEDFAAIVTTSSSPSQLSDNDRASPQYRIASGDDDDSGSDQSISRSPRGPRLFILKQRLMQSGVSNDAN